MMRELTPSNDMESGEGMATSRSAPPQAARNCGDNPLDRQLRRYAGRLRPHLRRVANESKAHADLLFSFPAASVAIATARPRGTRLRALRLIGRGAKLAEIADVLLLPMWTRRLPPRRSMDRCRAAFTSALATLRSDAACSIRCRRQG